MIEIKLEFSVEETENIARGLGWSESVPEINKETGEETMVDNTLSAEDFLQEKIQTHIEQLLSRYELRKVEVEQREAAKTRLEQAQANIRKAVVVTRQPSTRK